MAERAEDQIAAIHAILGERDLSDSEVVTRIRELLYGGEPEDDEAEESE